MEDVDKEISEMKLSLNARARTVAESYLTAVSSPLSSSESILTQLYSLVEVEINEYCCSSSVAHDPVLNLQ
jgi:hypothetical protein